MSRYQGNKNFLRKGHAQKFFIDPTGNLDIAPLFLITEDAEGAGRKARQQATTNFENLINNLVVCLPLVLLGYQKKKIKR
nr:MAG TPA: Intimin, Putative translocated intimin receptor-protein complex, unique intimin-Tir octamer.1A [Inoviridae sp.]